MISSAKINTFAEGETTETPVEQTTEDPTTEPSPAPTTESTPTPEVTPTPEATPTPTAVPTVAPTPDPNMPPTYVLPADTMQAGKQFTFTGMPYNGKYSPVRWLNGKKIKPGTTQNFAYTPDGKYVFATCQGMCGTGRHTILSRCSLPKKKNKDAKAEFQDGLILQGYGHGETLDVTQADLKKEEYDIWVATKPTGGFYGLQIARITYRVEPSGMGSIVKIVRLGNFKWTNVNKKGKADKFREGTEVFNVNRVNVSIDKDNNQICFRLEFTNDQIRYVIYDFKKINKALNKLDYGQCFNMKGAAKWQVANLKINAYPYKTFQSFCIMDNTLYLCGGYLNKGAQIYVVKYKTQKRGKTKEVKIVKKQYERFVKIETQLKIGKKTLGKDRLEIEGMKVYKNKKGKKEFFINFYQKDIPITSSVGVYKFKMNQTVPETEME